jgi:DNA-binding NtrC family response regulator
LDLQPHFLRVLEEGVIYRLGENTPRKINFKLIAATNRDLRDEVAEGRFRMDLFYRVSVTSIQIPPLREHREDIPALVLHFLDALAKQHGMTPKTIEPELIALLENHAWRGNVRELRNVVESMFLMCDGASLGYDDLPSEIGAGIGSPPISGVSAGVDKTDRHSSMTIGKLEDAELHSIRAILAADRGNMTLAARHLGIAKSTLYLKLKKYGLDHLVNRARSTLR